MGLLLFLFISIMAGIVGVLYLKYEADKKYQQAVENHMTAQNAIAGKANVTLRGLVESTNEVASAISYTPRKANAAMAARIKYSQATQSIALYFDRSNPAKNLSVLNFIEVLENLGTPVYTKVRDDADTNEYEADKYWLLIGNEDKETGESESIVLKIETASYDASQILDMEKFGKYVMDGRIACILTIHAYVSTDCVEECQTTLIAKVQAASKSLTSVEFAKKSTEGLIFVHKPDPAGYMIQQRIKYTEFDEKFFNVAYTELRTQGDNPQNVSAYKLINGLLKVWKNDKSNICIFGAPGTGKSSLLKAIAKKVSDSPGMKVLSISGQDFARHFSNPTFTSSLKSYANDDKVIVIVDEFHTMDLQSNATVKSVLDGMDSLENVSFVIATNEEKFEDEAILRAGRMDMVLNITAFQKKEDAENLYNLLVKQNADVHWKPFPEQYSAMTLADISGLKIPVSLLDAIK